MNTNVWFFVVLLVTAGVCVADESSEKAQTVEVVLDADGMVDCVEGIVDLLEGKLSGPGLVYYQAIERRYTINCYSCLGVAVFGLILSIVFVVVSSRLYTRDNMWALGIVFGSIGIFGSIVGCVINIINIATIDYLVMSEFINTVTTVVK